MEATKAIIQWSDSAISEEKKWKKDYNHKGSVFESATTLLQLLPALVNFPPNGHHHSGTNVKNIDKLTSLQGLLGDIPWFRKTYCFITNHPNTYWLTQHWFILSHHFVGQILSSDLARQFCSTRHLLELLTQLPSAGCQAEPEDARRLRGGRSQSHVIRDYVLCPDHFVFPTCLCFLVSETLHRFPNSR